MLASALKEKPTSSTTVIADDEQFNSTIETILAGVTEEVTDKNLDEYRKQVNSYLRKELISRNKGLGPLAKQTPEMMKPLLDLLVAFDKCATPIDLFK